MLAMVFMLGACLPSAAAEGGVLPSVVGFVRKVGRFIDTMAVSGVDPNYIVSPKKPWQVILQGNVNQSDVKMNTVINAKLLFDENWGNVNWESRIKTDISSYVGVWAGYRGYGIGYSRNVGGDKGSLFKLGATGGSYGVNLRIHNFETDEPTVKLTGELPSTEEYNGTFLLFDPIKVRTLTLDGYYLFNGKRFSYAAAYDQSVIQKRSAGSLMVGAMYYHSTIAYDQGFNADLIMLMNDVGKMKQYQVSVGAGYAYNLVPCKGLLVSGMVMPMLVFHNRLDLWRYDSKLREKAIEAAKNPSYEEDDEDFDLDDYVIYPMKDRPKVTQHSKMMPFIDARLSITYNTGNWFFNASGLLYEFRYSHDSNKGRLVDWYVNASVGLRL